MKHFSVMFSSSEMFTDVMFDPIICSVMSLFAVTDRIVANEIPMKSQSNIFAAHVCDNALSNRSTLVKLHGV